MARRRSVDKHDDNERGAAIIEFCLISIVWIPLLLGGISLGFDLIRAIQSSQVCRDVGHMSAYNVTFTQTQNQALLANIAKPLNITVGGGDGAIILSRITYLIPSDCTSANQSSCANTGHYVFTSLFLFGNPAADVAHTRLGNPSSDFLQGGRTIALNDYLNNTSLRADGLANSLTFLPNVSGQIAFVSEVNLRPRMTFASVIGGDGVYARSIF